MTGLIAAVDLGTGGPKVGLVGMDGRTVWETLVPVETRWLAGGGAVQDAGEWWDAICSALLAAPSGALADVSGVGLTGQWASTVPVDGGGLPVGDCVMWMDRRGAPYSRRVIGGPVAGLDPVAAAIWVRRAGVPPSPEGDDSLGHMLFLQNSGSAARWYLEPVDYLAMRLTGTAAATPASMIAAWLTRSGDYDPVLVKRSGVDPSKLPPLRPTGSVIGRVSAAAARSTGLPEGVPVVAGVPDLHSAAVGSGCVGLGEAHLAVSTTSWISCPVESKKTDFVNQMATVPGLGAGEFLVVNNQDSAGRCLQWVRDAWFPESAYDELVALAGTAPPGANRVIFTPWMKGERSPVADRFARGGFHNLSLSTTRADMVRAVLEGVAYNSRWLLAATEKFAGRRLEPLRVIGGGARSDLWCQILADVTGHRIERVAEPQSANLRGAALFAGLSLGLITPPSLRPLVRIDGTFVPGPAAAEYSLLFAEFPRLYKAQKRMFARLNRSAAPQ